MICDVGPEKRQRARQRRHALAVAADNGKRNRRRVCRARRSRARDRQAPALRRHRRPAPASAACRASTDSAGDFPAALTHAALAYGNCAGGETARCRSPTGTGSIAVHPGEDLLVRHVEPALEFVELGIAQGRRYARRQNGRGRDPFRGCRDARQRNSSRRRRASSPSLERFVPCSPVSPTPKTRTGPGAGLYRGLAAQCQPPVCTGLHCAGIPRKPAWRHAAARAQSAVCCAHQPARRRAEAGEALCPPARPRSAARRRSAVPSAVGRRSTAARGRNCASAGRTRSSPSP